jgi:hypothetical protein
MIPRINAPMVDRMGGRTTVMHLHHVTSVLCGIALLLGLVPAGQTQERWRGDPPRGFPYTERFEGERRWRPDLPRDWERPDRIIINRPGKCVVRCERHGRDYRCREYRC